MLILTRVTRTSSGFVHRGPFSTHKKDIYTADQMVEENPEVVASITEGGDFKKPSEKKKTGETEKKDKSEDKKVEEVESASGEKVVRAAHVPVPSQVCCVHFLGLQEIVYG